MDTGQIISTVIAVLGGSGGLVALYRAYSTKQVGLSGVEVEDKAVNTADWSVWQEHWPAQIERLDREVDALKEETKFLRESRQRDEEAHAAERRQWFAERDHLNALLDERDRWIYEGKPPPPPIRRPFPPEPTQ